MKFGSIIVLLLIFSIATIMFNDPKPPSNVQFDPKPEVEVSLPDTVTTFSIQLKDDLDGLVRDIKQFLRMSK